MLNEWMKNNDITDAAFGLRIGRGRLAVLRYRHGQQMPRPEIAAKIEAITGGEVTPSDHHRALMLRVSEENAA